MTRSALSPQDFADENQFENRTVTVDNDSITFILEKMTNGNAKIRACWNQKQVTEINPNDEEGLVWDFNEWVLSWVPAPTFTKDGVTITTMATMIVDEKEVIDEATTKANVADYIASNAVEILGYAKNAYYLMKL
ncbi:MAG: hypothetical protein ABFD07_14195 [Methanobacterium sp.]